MQIPVQITFRDMDSSPALRELVEKKAEKLDTFHDHIMSCRVVLEAPHRSQAHGRAYRARIDLKVPGHEIVAGDRGSRDVQHQDMYAAIEDAFDDAGRQLRELARVQRGDVKSHSNKPPPPHMA